MEIFLIRHGTTAGNLEQRYVGTTDEPLTEDSSVHLEENRGAYPCAAMVFSSPLRRCVQTAKLLYPEADILPLEGLRECDFGEFEYKNYMELQSDARYQAWIDSSGTIAFPGGESREQFADRCCEAFREGCARAKRAGTKQVAFVVHGGTIMAILDRFSSPHRDYFEWQVKNAEGFACRLNLKERDRFADIDNPGIMTDGRSGGDVMCLSDIRTIPAPPALTGIEHQYVMKKNKKLRCGYTTGSCAAAASKAAVEMLLSGRICFHADLLTPKGIRLHLPVEAQKITEEYASCAVKKYSGDDPDATDGILVYARAEYMRDDFAFGKENAGNGTKGEGDFCQIFIDGGIGVGRVTKAGLEQPVGAAAINRVPREMIRKEAENVCELYEYRGGVKITISVPEGEEIAKRTFNPHLGIVGGISILGTSGIVVPMSEEALIASIRVEMKQKVEQGEQYILITPGNYGADFIRRETSRQTLSESPAELAGVCSGSGENHLTEDSFGYGSLNAEDSMKCSNYVGETLDIAEELGVKGILFVAHIGKFIKVSGGIMNTHSAHADCRAELMAAQAARAGASSEIVRRLLDTNTTEEAVGILAETDMLEPTMAEVTRRIQFHLQKHCRGALQTEVILFSNQHGYLGETDGADAMAEKIMEQERIHSSAGQDLHTTI